jgi:hypothetical protein
MALDSAVQYSPTNKNGTILNSTLPEWIEKDSKATQTAALIIVDMTSEDLGKETHSNKTQRKYMEEVLNAAIEKKMVVIQCVINKAEPLACLKKQTYQSYETYTRDKSGSVLRGSEQVTIKKDPPSLSDRLDKLNPILIMGWDANFCVQSSIFGSPEISQEEPVLSSKRTDKEIEKLTGKALKTAQKTGKSLTKTEMDKIIYKEFQTKKIVEVPGLISMNKTVLTSRVVLVPLKDKLESGFGVIAGQ